METLQSPLADARALAARPGRTILGITGAPGAGKSTLTEAIVRGLGPDVVALAPMDGFHLSNEILAQRGLRDRKGAIETFDDAGYAALLTRVRLQEPGTLVYAPRYERHLEESIGSALPIVPDVPLVVTEGNYLLADTGHWPRARAVMDEVWFLDLDATLRRERLIERHVSHGDDRVSAERRAMGSDDVNAEVVDRMTQHADRVVRLEG